jgi:transposase
MTALRPQPRIGTAREVAERFGVHPRTVQRIVAEPREDFEARARARQGEALALLESGFTYRQVAERLGITRSSAAGLVHRARARQERSGKAAA